MQHRLAAQTINSELDCMVSGEQIPALAPGVPRLLEKLSQDDIEIAELSESIAEFPSIAIRLLFLANSAWSAPIVPIDNIQFACSKLGLSVIRSVSIALSIASPFNPILCTTFDTYKYWLNALMVGEISKQLAAEIGAIPESQTSALQTAGILHNIGLLWLADRLPAQTTLAFVEYTNAPGISLEQCLMTHCQFGYCSVNGKLAQAWNFPPLLHNVITYYNTPEFEGEFHHQCRTVGLATAICKYVLGDDFEQIEFTDSRISTLGISEQTLKSVVAQSASKRERFAEVIKIFLQAN